MFQVQAIIYVIIVASIAGLWKIFSKAGESGWKALIPIYNYYVWLKILKRPWWWVFILLVPGVGFMMIMAITGITSARFPRNRNIDIVAALLTLGFEALTLFYILPAVGLSTVLTMALYAITLYLVYLTGKPLLAILSNKNAKAAMHPALIMIVTGILFPVFLPVYGFGKSAFQPEAPGKDKKVKPSVAHEWTEAIVFAIIAATIIRTFTFEAYTIPTPSMEKSLMVGDYLFVSKASYGARIPMTPISFPFAHSSLVNNINCYLEWLEYPSIRIPGYSKVKRHDIVVFNFPEGDTVTSNINNPSYYALCRELGRDNILHNRLIKNFGRQGADTFAGYIIVRPLDREENYIKRCIGTPGDSLTVKRSQVYINGVADDVPVESQMTYTVRTRQPLDQNAFKKLDITDENASNGQLYNGFYYYDLSLTKNSLEKLKAYPDVDTIAPEIDRFGVPDSLSIFPFSSHYNWNKDNYGPIWIPKEGATVKLDMRNLPLYKRLISAYEHNNLEIKGNAIYINGALANSYTFKQNYYFMMGDNRHNSEDSRYWGFVPEDHIVGRASFIWASLKENVPLSQKFRLNRFFTFVSPDGLSRSYLIPGLLILVIFILYGFIKNKRNEKKMSKSAPNTKK
jgi:signal peptidase I